MDSLSLTECVQKLGVTSSDIIIKFLEDQKRNGFIYYSEDLNTIQKIRNLIYTSRKQKDSLKIIMLFQSHAIYIIL